ncbi:MAG TPA: diguanylate cyclase [Pyrinomonadaceae bacterium]|nr:diguanylate cyclase [Pyrinomonadaceae bacterium]
MSPHAGKKQKMLDRVAEDNGVAVVVLDESSREVSVSNNNSICRALTSSSKFSKRCANYCGVAYRNTASGESFDYQCYAGLKCRAVSVEDQGKRFVAIVGRTFVSAEKYREATDRAIARDWREFPTDEFFDNILIAGSASNIDNAVDDLAKFRVEKAVEVAAPAKEKQEEPAEEIVKLIEKFGESSKTELPTPQASAEWNERRKAEASEMRSLAGRLAKLDYTTGAAVVLDFLTKKFGLKSLVWLERKETRLVPITSIGALRSIPVKIGISVDNPRLVAASQEERPLELHERIADGEERPSRTLQVFASMVGGEIRGAIGVEGTFDEETLRSIVIFCRRISPQLEILRLRRELSDREWINRAVTRFSESLKRIDAEDFWTHVTQVSAELVQSERASLLLRSEQADELVTKAAVGARINLFSEPNVGQRVSKLVLEDGNPVVVEDIKRIGIRSAPPSWRYKTNSFLSYPITIGKRMIGVMNFTDKVTGDAFDERDLELLEAIAPQIAVAIDRTVLKDKAGEFEQLSVTDALTGLLNRRYLEKRLIEEIQRSKRHRFPMSLMMLDVDEFKSYNDAFGHPAGDAALRIVAGVLQDILRGADVAARYGGEEFAILLPQTTSVEAATIAERLRQRIEHTEFPKRQVTVSIGIASISNDLETPADVVGAADHALYEAKNQGRNNVRVYDGYGKTFNENIH